jgi:hypothetical protein
MACRAAGRGCRARAGENRNREWSIQDNRSADRTLAGHGEWFTPADPLTAARRERPVVEFAGEILAERSQKISNQIEKIRELDAEHRGRFDGVPYRIRTGVAAVRGRRNRHQHTSMDIIKLLK